MSLISVVLFLFIFNKSPCGNCYVANDLSDYFEQRQKIITEEESRYLGARVTLTEAEQRANDVLMKYKYAELKSAFEEPQSFLPSRNFLKVSRSIERSRVFRAIRRMPKAGVLHAHLSAITSRDFVLGNITRRPNLYVCWDPRTASIARMRFLEVSPDEVSQGHGRCSWQLLSELRRTWPAVDERIAEKLTMFEDDPYRMAKGVDAAWKRFLGIFHFLKPLVTYRPVYEDFLYHTLQELHDDNVQFVEIRTAFSSLYELNGHIHHHLQVIEIYNQVVDRFVKDHPDFLGVKWIFSKQRKVTRSRFASYARTFRALREAHPDLVVGFDLIGQEDKGRPLVDFVPELRSLGAGTQFFFHAGETNWNGFSADENLVDAVLLNTRRIGHGYALMKHPKLMELVERRGIAIEVSPISNQVLKLVKDLRNHPASYLFARDLPLVVSSDDPGFWGARALSYDFYEAFVGIMSSRADLRALKQLALNSIVYSSLSYVEKQRVQEVWQRRWDLFVAEIAAET